MLIGQVDVRMSLQDLYGSTHPHNNKHTAIYTYMYITYMYVCKSCSIPVRQ